MEKQIPTEVRDTPKNAVYRNDCATTFIKFTKTWEKGFLSNNIFEGRKLESEQNWSTMKISLFLYSLLLVTAAAAVFRKWGNRDFSFSFMRKLQPNFYTVAGMRFWGVDLMSSASSLPCYPFMVSWKNSRFKKINRKFSSNLRQLYPKRDICTLSVKCSPLHFILVYFSQRFQCIQLKSQRRFARLTDDCWTRCALICLPNERFYNTCSKFLIVKREKIFKNKEKEKIAFQKYICVKWYKLSEY